MKPTMGCPLLVFLCIKPTIGTYICNMKKELVIITLLFLAGILSAQLVGKNFFITYGFLNTYHLQAFALTKLDNVLLFWNILWERGKLFLLLIILGFTPLKKILPIFVKGILAYTIGLYGAACVMNIGILGLGVLACSIFPHGILYIMVCYLFLHMEHPFLFKDRKRIFMLCLSGIILCIMFLMGCILETTVGTSLLQTFLKKVLI